MALDQTHDWLYRQMEHWIDSFDARFAIPGQDAKEGPPSTLRVDFEAVALHQRNGEVLTGITDMEAVVHLPNIERRLKLFVTSEDLQESPAGPTGQSSALRAGLRYELRSSLNFDFGIRTNLIPSAFSTVKWAPTFKVEGITVSPLVELYADSRLGYGNSDGLTLEQWHQQWIVRGTSYIDWRHATSGVSGVDWSETVIIGYAPQIISEHQYGTVASGHDIVRGAVLRLYVAGDQRASSATREVSVIIKRPLHAGWLLGYVEPQIRWSRGSEWHPDVGIGIGVNVLFLQSER